MKRQVVDKVQDATLFLKALANENRLLVLCHLLESEKTVTELEGLLGIRQPTLSQQLARLRAENLVATRRVAKSIYYRLASDDVARIIEILHGKFCGRTAVLAIAADERPRVEERVLA